MVYVGSDSLYALWQVYSFYVPSDLGYSMTREWLDNLTDDELKMLRAWEMFSADRSAGWLYYDKLPDKFQPYLDQASEEFGTSTSVKIAFKDYMMSYNFMLTDKDLVETLALIKTQE